MSDSDNVVYLPGYDLLRHPSLAYKLTPAVINVLCLELFYSDRSETERERLGAMSIHDRKLALEMGRAIFREKNVDMHALSLVMKDVVIEIARRLEAGQ